MQYQSEAHKTQKNLLISQILKYAPGTIFPALLYLATTAIVTRLFNSTEYGRYILFLNTALLFSALTSQWLQQGINRFLPGRMQSDYGHELKKAIGVALIFVIIPICILFSLLILYLSDLYYLDMHTYLLPLVTLLFTTSLYAPLTVVLQASMRAAHFTIYRIADASFRFIVGLLTIFYVYRDPATLIWVSSASLLILIPLIWKENGLPNPLGLWKILASSSVHIKTFMLYGLPMTGWYFAFTLLNFGDRYIIEYMRGTAEVGIYSANYGLVAGAISLLSAPILSASHPFLISSWNQNDVSAAAIWLGKIMEWFLQFGVLMLALLIIFGQDIVKILLGIEYREGWKVMPIAFGGLVAWQLGMYAHKPLEFMGRTTTMLIIGIIAAALNIALNIFLIPIYGYMAAAYATLSSYVVYTVLSYWIGRRILQANIRWRLIILRSAMIVISAVLLNAIRSSIEGALGYNAGVSISAVIALVGAVFMVKTLVRSSLIT